MFDPAPFGLPGIILAAEAVLIAGFVLITQNRQNAYADKRGELDYEVSVRTYREIMALRKALEAAQAAAGQYGGGDAG